MNDFIHRRFQKFRSDENDEHIDDKSADVFQSAVSPRMPFILVLARQSKADQRDHRGSRVGNIVESVRNDRHGNRENPYAQLPRKQEKIEYDARNAR